MVSDLGSDSDWTQIRTEILDCLIITFYPNEGMFPEGDILYVETNKYRKAGLANIDIGILAPQPIKTPNAWLVAGYPFPLPDEVPVIFKNVSASWENSTDTIFQSLAEWLAFIDEPASHGRVSENARQFLQTVKATLPENNFSKFQGAEIYKTRLSTHLNQISDTVAITFETK